MFSGVNTPPSFVQVTAKSCFLPSSVSILSAWLSSPFVRLIGPCSKPEDLVKKRICFGSAAVSDERQPQNRVRMVRRRIIRKVRLVIAKVKSCFWIRGKRILIGHQLLFQLICLCEVVLRLFLFPHFLQGDGTLTKKVLPPWPKTDRFVVMAQRRLQLTFAAIGDAH